MYGPRSGAPPRRSVTRLADGLARLGLRLFACGFGGYFGAEALNIPIVYCQPMEAD